MLPAVSTLEASNDRSGKVLVPLSSALSATKMNVFAFAVGSPFLRMLLLAVRSGPAKDIFGEFVSIPRKFAAAVMLLLLSPISGRFVVLVKLELFTRTRAPARLRVLLESLSKGPARLRVAPVPWTRAKSPKVLAVGGPPPDEVKASIPFVVSETPENCTRGSWLLLVMWALLPSRRK
jgi:hypothetical protein